MSRVGLGPEAQAIRGARRRWFRLVGLVAPLLLLGAVEAGLRLAGCGYPTSFFLKSRQEGRAVLTDNPWFAWRFFPRAVARAPRPFCLAASKPPGTVRLFVLGESAALGDPEPSYGFARQLERLLQARHSGQTVEVVNVAMTAIDSHAMRDIARDCAPRQGDFWLVYAGNNEVLGPFGAGTVFGRMAPPLWAARLSLGLQRLRLGQLVARLGRSAKEPGLWQGLELFLEHRVSRADPRLQKVYANFAANLGDVVAMGRRAGARVVLSTMPVNLRDSPPFSSLHRAGLGTEAFAQWEQLLARGVAAQAEGKFGDALSAYQQAARIDAEFAELVFRRAQCELKLEQTTAAAADFRLACDLDALRFRADSRLNEIIRQTAAAQGVALLDAEKELSRDADRPPAAPIAGPASSLAPRAAAPEAILGQEFYYDHVHLNFAGNYRVARLFAAQVEPDWPGGAAATAVGQPAAGGSPAPWLSEAEVARQLAFTDFDRRRVAELMRARLQQPPFVAQSNFRERDEHWRQVIEALPRAVRGIPTSSGPVQLGQDAPATGQDAPAREAEGTYQAAVALAPRDWTLRANFAALLQDLGDEAGAAAQWSEVARLLPHDPRGWFNLGRLARAAGKPSEAEGYLREGLRRRPDSADLLTEFGLLQVGRGATEDARRRFRAALALQPGFSAARVNLGLLLAKNGDTAGAEAQYREELRWHTNNVEARINLANLLDTQGRADAALALYTEAAALQADSPVARYSLGRMLAAKGRTAEAVAHLEAAVQLRPDLAEPRCELGLALGRLGRDAAALAQFAEAARLKPGLVDARFNYGVALAKAGRYDEAAAEFRQTLRLRPDHPYAARMLDQAERRAGR